MKLLLDENLSRRLLSFLQYDYPGSSHVVMLGVTSATLQGVWRPRVSRPISCGLKILTDGTDMPEISRFLGIVISMYFDEHNPSHFHVRYNDFRAVMDIQSLNIRQGTLPARVRGPVEEWAELHQAELLAMWETKEFHKIAPLV